MGMIRAFLCNHRRLALLLLALALVAKAAVPAGYMLGTQGKVLTVAICADAQGTSLTKQIVVPHSGKADGGAQAKGDCAWSALGFAALAGADAALLALALLFILALGFAPAAPPLLPRVHRLLPPLRGPPVSA